MPEEQNESVADGPGPWGGAWPERGLSERRRRPRLEEYLFGGAQDQGESGAAIEAKLARVQAELRDQSVKLEAVEAELEVLKRRAGTEVEPLAAAQAAPLHHLLFVPGAKGYALVEREGAAPGLGSCVEGEESAYVVSKVGRSPLPLDSRPCAYLQRAR